MKIVTQGFHHVTMVAADSSSVTERHARFAGPSTEPRSPGGCGRLCSSRRTSAIRL